MKSCHSRDVQDGQPTKARLDAEKILRLWLCLCICKEIVTPYQKDLDLSGSKGIFASDIYEPTRGLPHFVRDKYHVGHCQLPCYEVLFQPWLGFLSDIVFVFVSWHLASGGQRTPVFLTDRYLNFYEMKRLKTLYFRSAIVERKHGANTTRTAEANDNLFKQTPSMIIAWDIGLILLGVVVTCIVARDKV